MPEELRGIRLLDAQEIADMLKTSRQYIYNLIHRGKFPDGVKLGSNHRWTIREIEDWLAHRRIRRSAAEIGKKSTKI